MNNMEKNVIVLIFALIVMGYTLFGQNSKECLIFDNLIMSSDYSLLEFEENKTTIGMLLAYDSTFSPYISEFILSAKNEGEIETSLSGGGYMNGVVSLYINEVLDDKFYYRPIGLVKYMFTVRMGDMIEIKVEREYGASTERNVVLGIKIIAL